MEHAQAKQRLEPKWPHARDELHENTGHDAPLNPLGASRQGGGSTHGLSHVTLGDLSLAYHNQTILAKPPFCLSGLLDERTGAEQLPTVLL